MSPPEIWGPPIWTLFHTLAERIKEEDYIRLIPQLFGLIRRVCMYLPCPECSQHATKFINSVKQSQLATKQEFKNTFYIFHNMVNKRKNKPLFDYGQMKKYENVRIIHAFNDFVRVYHTKGNMKMISESFQRSFIIRDFKNWLSANIASFVWLKPQLPITILQTTPIQEIENEIENNSEK